MVWEGDDKDESQLRDQLQEWIFYLLRVGIKIFLKGNDIRNKQFVPC